MTQITRTPTGLQDFLGTQAQGANPSELAGVVSPIVDFGDFIGIRTERWYSDAWTPFSGGPNHNEQVVVPEGELWVLKTLAIRCSVQAGGAAGDGFTVSFLMSSNSNSNAPISAHCLALPYKYEINATAGRVDTQYVGIEVNDIVAPPGASITGSIHSVVGNATFNPTFQLRYRLLKI